eukprot:5822600-Pyramimonas_sp.AAC.1
MSLLVPLSSPDTLGSAEGHAPEEGEEQEARCRLAPAFRSSISTQLMGTPSEVEMLLRGGNKEDEGGDVAEDEKGEQEDKQEREEDG